MPRRFRFLVILTAAVLAAVISPFRTHTAGTEILLLPADISAVRDIKKGQPTAQRGGPRRRGSKLEELDGGRGVHPLLHPHDDGADSVTGYSNSQPINKFYQYDLFQRAAKLGFDDGIAARREVQRPATVPRAQAEMGRYIL